MGKGILHVHTTFSDGLATTEEILDELHRNSDADVVAFADHDDVRAFFAAQAWKERHPESRLEPLWACELTIAHFKHLLAFVFEPPFPRQPPRKFLPLEEAVRQIHAMGGVVVVPHPDAFWVGIGRHRLGRVAHDLGIAGIELFNPYQRSRRSIGNLRRFNERHALLALGGCDAHHIEDLYQVHVEYPGQGVAALHRAFRERTVQPVWGATRSRVPMRQQLRQHTRSMVVSPYQQISAWLNRRVISTRA